MSFVYAQLMLVFVYISIIAGILVIPLYFILKKIFSQKHLNNLFLIALSLILAFIIGYFTLGSLNLISLNLAPATKEIHYLQTPPEATTPLR